MEENKLYIKLGNYDNKDNIITGYFICFCKKPYKAQGCEFDTKKDFEKAINIKTKYLNEIKINQSQYINGEFIAN